MIKTTTCIYAACDICGAAPENEYDGISHFDVGQDSDALTEAESQDWWIDRNTSSVLCDERDDAHLDRAREIYAGLSEDDRITFLTYWPELDEQGRGKPELLGAYQAHLDDELEAVDAAEAAPTP